MTTIERKPRNAREWLSTLVQKWIGVVLVVLSLASVIVVAVYSSRLADVTECQAQYNDAYTKAIEARSFAARDERQAMRELILTFLGRPITPQEARAAMDRYVKKLDEADLARDRAQIPDRRC